MAFTSQTPFFVSKIDLENMTKFAKLQDSRIKLVYKDEDLENFDYKAENRYDVKEKIKNFGQEIKKIEKTSQEN
jgi:hypothetical protein